MMKYEMKLNLIIKITIFHFTLFYFILFCFVLFFMIEQIDYEIFGDGKSNGNIK